MYRFNFLPTGGREGALPVEKQLSRFFYFCLAAVLLLAGAYCFFLHQLADLKRAEAAARANFAARQEGLAGLVELRKERASKERAVDELRAALSGVIPWSPTLSALGAALPADAWLVKLEVSPKEKGESGVPAGGAPVLVIEGYTRSLSSAGVLASALGGVGRLSAVELKEVKADVEEKAYYFKITAQVAGGGS